MLDPAILMSANTAIYRPQDRFSYWREIICALLSPADNCQDGQRDFSATLKRTFFGQLELIDLASSPIVSVRDNDLLRKLPNDDFFICSMVSGSAEMRQSGRSAKLSAGDVVLYESARSFKWRFCDDYRLLLARIPRRAMLCRLDGAERLTARVLRADQPFASMISTSIMQAVDLDETAGGSNRHKLGNTLVDLFAASVESGLVRGELSIQNVDLLDKAKTFLRTNIENSEFVYDDLVKHLGVSERTVCRLFAADGTTAMRWFWQQRLALAHTLLEQGTAATVSQVAMRCGFNDFSHFGRSFKRTFGEEPRAVLGRAVPRRS